MTTQEEAERLRLDDANWKGGIFYACPQDRAFLVSKRYGTGRTINVGSPWMIVLAIAVITVIVWAVVF